MEGTTEMKFGTRVAYKGGWCRSVEYAHSAQKARDTTLNDEKYNLCNIKARHIDRTCIVLTALGNQPEAFALDLSDDQSRYLFESTGKYFKLPWLILCSMLKVALMWDRVLQVSCIANVLQTSLSSFCQLLFIQYSICEYTSVSHCSLNFDAPIVGYGFALIMLFPENLTH